MNKLTNKNFIKAKHVINSCYCIEQLDVLDKYIDLYIEQEENESLGNEICQLAFDKRVEIENKV